MIVKQGVVALVGRPSEQSVVGRRVAEAYAARVAAALRPPPAAVILYGSVARGTARRHSDIDIIVIADGLPDDWFDRLDILGDARRTGEGRVQVIGYTLDEFAAMLAKAHLTALEAVDHGVVLVGGVWFAQQRERLVALKREGWRRTPRGWYRETGSNGSAAYCG
ncbi:MAG: nucleotidyltransferase domain-containing protein [Chloroflexota bacterium]|nr:nucleotidyltransferase domain-containing protein [Chloroflexota bacterium]